MIWTPPTTAGYGFQGATPIGGSYKCSQDDIAKCNEFLDALGKFQAKCKLGVQQSMDASYDFLHDWRGQIKDKKLSPALAEGVGHCLDYISSVVESNYSFSADTVQLFKTNFGNLITPNAKGDVYIYGQQEWPGNFWTVLAQE